MIFDKLFSPTLKSKDPSKRLKAIEGVDRVDETNRTRLHELAFNDEDIEVRLAALTKLDTFSLWVKAYESKHADKIVTKAKQALLRLLESVEAVPQDLFNEFVLQAQYKDIVKEMLKNSVRLVKESDTRLLLIQKQGTDTDLLGFFKAYATEQQQVQIIESQAKNEKFLRRLSKLTLGEDVNSQLTSALEELQRIAQLPSKLISEAKLVNAQLNALNDSQDYDYIERNKARLSEEFESLKPQFVYLNENTRAELSEKYLLLKNKLEQKLQNLLPEYEQKLAVKALTEEQKVLEEQISSIEEQVTLMLDVEQEESFQTQQELLLNAINDAADSAKQLAHRLQENAHIAQQKRQVKINERIESVRSQLVNAQNILVNNSALKKVLIELDKMWQTFEEGNLSLQSLASEVDLLTNNISDKAIYSPGLFAEFSQFKKRLRQLMSAKAKEQQNLSKRCANKLTVVGNLIRQGKYRAAMATFNVAKDLFDSIEVVSRGIQKKYDDMAAEVQNLKDWQSYIATPKKPMLLEQADSLINNAELSPPERAAKIKQLREEWNSLGRLHDEEDEALNKRFDDKLEEAFAPCREYFAQREKERNDNAQRAEEILSKIEALQNLEDSEALVQEFQKHAQTFRQIKTLEHNKRRELLAQFKAISAPIQRKIDGLYEQRKAAKKRLIKQAEALTLSESMDEAAQQAKSLQAQWKKIGFTGKKSDADLWQTFRDVNDTIFSAFQANKAQSLASSENSLNEALLRLESIVNQANEVTSSDLRHKIAQLKDLQSQYQALEKGHSSKLSSAIANASKALHQQVSKLSEKEQLTSIRALFDAVILWDCDQIVANGSPLIKQAIEQSLAKHSLFDNFTRSQRLQSILVLLDLQNDTGLAIEKDVQLQVMAVKLEGKTDLSEALAFAYWLSEGPLSENDKTQFELCRPYLEKASTTLL